VFAKGHSISANKSNISASKEKEGKEGKEQKEGEIMGGKRPESAGCAGP